jgi:cell volume regulation protein A
MSLIVRDDDALPPRGSTVVLAGDHLDVLIRRERSAEMGALFQLWHNGAASKPE